MLSRYLRSEHKINANYMQALIAECVEECGGEAHPMTIAEFALRSFPRLVKDKKEMPFDVDDFRSAVSKQVKKNGDAFESSGEAVMLTESEWVRRRRSSQKWHACGFAQEREYREGEVGSTSITGVLLSILQGRQGLMLEAVVGEARSLWKPNPRVLAPRLGLMELIELTLETNPIFRNYMRDPLLWELIPTGDEKALRKRLKEKAKAEAVSPSFGGSSPGSSGLGGGSRKRRREPSRAAATVTGAGGAPVASTAPVEEQWIQCDECQKWVNAPDDHTITDLSLYDDTNPNHLEYYCPSCREERARRSRVRRKPDPVLAVSTAPVEDRKDALGKFKAALLREYRRAPEYWRNTVSPYASEDVRQRCHRLEADFVEAISHAKRRIKQKYASMGGNYSRDEFSDFFYTQLDHLKMSIEDVLSITK